MSMQRLLSKEQIDVRRRIDEIIDECKNHGVRKISYLYKLLTEFIYLKRTENPRYNWSNLLSEDLGLRERDIRLVRAYQFVSDSSKKKIKEGKITENQICSYLWKYEFAREELYQQKICEAIENKKYSWGFMTKWSRDQARDVLNGKKPIEEDRKLTSFMVTIQYFFVRVKNLKLKRNKQLIDLIKALKRLLEYLENIK